MMSKLIDLSKTVYEICKEDPQVIEIMRKIGFEEIATPGMLQTAGRFMTIPKGAQLKKISLDKLKEIFQNYGYQIQD